MIFTTDMQNGSEPSVHWSALPGVDEIYTGWWIELSPNWTPSPRGAGQITYLFSGDGVGQVFTGFTHPCVWPEACNAEVQGRPYKITAKTNWAPYGPNVWYRTWRRPGPIRGNGTVSSSTIGGKRRQASRATESFAGGWSAR
jgi:hypothetical protein